MVFETMSRKEFAIKMDISRTTLYRRMLELDPEYQKAIAGKILLAEDVEYIYYQIQKRKRQGSIQGIPETGPERQTNPNSYFNLKIRF